jgi:hypothetical protein
VVFAAAEVEEEVSSGPEPEFLHHKHGPLATWQPFPGMLDAALRSACLAFPRQQPFNTLRKFPTDPKQDLRTILHLPSFHRR